MIAANKIGLFKGASVKEKAGVITSSELAEIGEIIRLAKTQDFRPLLYVIPRSLVERLIVAVPVAMRAHPLSGELLIEALPGDLFDVLELRTS